MPEPADCGGQARGEPVDFRVRVRLFLLAVLAASVISCDQPEVHRNRAPSVVITQGPQGTIAADSARFEWSGADADGNLTGFYWSLDDPAPGTFTDSSGVTIRSILPGEHDFYLRALDDSAALSLTAVQSFVCEYSNPALRKGTDTTLDVATWNLLYFPHSDQTISVLRSLIPALDLDIYGVQEIADTIAFRQLLAVLPGYSGVFSDDDYGGYYLKTGIIYKQSVVSLGQVRTLFRYNDSVTRAPLLAEVSATVGGRTFDFRMVVMHLKAGGSQDDFAQRRATCRLLKEYVDGQLAAGGDSDFVLLGDWNDELDDPPAKNLFQPFLDDSLGYRALTLPMAGNSYYGSYIGGGLIDHIVVTRAAMPEYGDGTCVTLRLDDDVPGYEENISDHRPVMAAFMLP